MKLLHRSKLITFTSAMFMLVIGLLASCRSNPEIDQEALDLLKKVEEQYSSMKTFRLDATITTELEGAGRNRTIEIPLSYTASKPGKMRLEVRHDRAPVTMVSDDSVTWTYNKSTNEFSRTRASTLQSGGADGPVTPTDQQFLHLAQSLIDPYMHITKNLKSATIVAQEEMDLQGKTVKTYLVEATYKDELQSRRPDAEVTPTKYWIVANQLLVLKQIDEYMLPSAQTDDSVRVRETTLINNVQLNPPLASEVFTFDKPKDAERVDQISIGGPAGGSTMEGRQAPSFTLPDLSGQRVSLSDYRGQVVLLDFWATWCAPCRRAHPDIQALYEQYKDEGLVVLGINNEGRHTAREYMQKHSYTFTTLLDTTDTIAGRYGVTAMPYYFVIERDGNITSEIMGYRPKSDMLKALQKAGLTSD